MVSDVKHEPWIPPWRSWNFIPNTSCKFKWLPLEIREHVTRKRTHNNSRRKFYGGRRSRSQRITQQVNENSQEMAMQFGLPPPQPLDLSSLNISENGKKFKQKYTSYGINKKESATRVATLVTVIGNEAIDVFNTLTWDAKGDDTKIDKVLQEFEEYCEPRKNVSYERYKSFSRSQESGETIDQYVTVLIELSEMCEFVNTKELTHQRSNCAWCK